MRMLLVIAFSVAGILGASAQQRTVVSHYFACKASADLAAIIEAVKKNDDAAFGKIAERVFPENSCALLHPTEVVQVERTNSDGQQCIRRARDSVCLWTDETAFRPNPEVEQWKAKQGQK
jgi:hypothetical protein